MAGSDRAQVSAPRSAYVEARNYHGIAVAVLVEEVLLRVPLEHSVVEAGLQVVEDTLRGEVLELLVQRWLVFGPL